MSISKSVQDALRLASWASMVGQVESHTHGMARLCGFRESFELMAAASRKLSALPLPATDAEMAIRGRQESAVINLIGSIAHADGMARLHPVVAAEIFVEAGKLIDGDLPTTRDEYSQALLESSTFSLSLSQICHADSMRQLRA